MKEEQFNIRMEKMDDHTSDSKYAIIGYFAEQQEKHNRMVARAAAKEDPISAIEPVQVVSQERVTPVAAQQSATINTPASQDAPVSVKHTITNIMAQSTAEQWLLAFIAFLLFINLICKN